MLRPPVEFLQNLLPEVAQGCFWLPANVFPCRLPPHSSPRLLSLHILACHPPRCFPWLTVKMGDSHDFLHKAPSWGCFYDVLGWGSFSKTSVWEAVIILSRLRRKMPCVRKTLLPGMDSLSEWTPDSALECLIYKVCVDLLA